MVQRSAVSQRGSLELQELKEKVALAHRVLHYYGLAMYLGAVSVRIPGTDHIVMKGQPHISMDMVQTEDLMVIDLDGNIIEQSDDYPIVFGEWPLFTEVYKVRPDVNCAIHTHQKWCTVLGIAGRPVLPVQVASQAAVAAEPWPIYDESFEIVKTVQQGRVVAKLMLGNHVACHLKTHGMLFVGADIERGMIAAIDGERQAERTWHALVAGKPEPIPRMYMRAAVDRQFLPEADMEAQSRWSSFVWLDQHSRDLRRRVVPGLDTFLS